MLIMQVMKKTIIFSLISFLSVLSLSSCKVEVINKDSGPVKTYNVPVKNFNRISIAYPADVVYIPADTFSLTVKASEKARKDLQIDVENGMLELKTPEMWQKNKHYLFQNKHYDDVTVIVKAPTLKYVAIVGSGSFKCDTTMTTPKLDLEVAGSGEIDVKNLRANSFSAKIAGSGDIDAGLTEVDNTSIKIAGSGDVDMHFTHCGSVTTSIAGAGDIKLSGDIKSLSNDIAGSGDIDTDDLTIRK